MSNLSYNSHCTVACHSLVPVHLDTVLRVIENSKYLPRDLIMKNYYQVTNKVEFIKQLFDLGNNYVQVALLDDDIKTDTRYEISVLEDMDKSNYFDATIHRADDLLYEFSTDFNDIPEEYRITYVKDLVDSEQIVKLYSTCPKLRIDLSKYSCCNVKVTMYGLTGIEDLIFTRELLPSEDKYFSVYCKQGGVYNIF